MDTVGKMDLMFHSLAGAALDIGSSWYSDSVLASVFDKAGVQDDIIRRFGGGARARYAGGFHPFRRTLSWATDGIVDPVSKHLETVTREGANRMAGRAFSKLTDDAALAKRGGFKVGDLDRIKNAVKFRNLSIGITGLWVGALGSSVAMGVTDALRQRGAAEIGKKWSLNHEGFQDSRMAYTSRQRALRAIQSSQSGFNRAWGQEAKFLHSYR